MPKAQNEITFEQGVARLEEIVSLLDSGKADLEESLARYEEGMRLLRICRERLNSAEQKIELLKRIDAETGEIETEPADPEQLRSDETTAGRRTRRSTKE